MFKFLHAADIHLDSPLRNLERKEDAPADELRLATRRALEKLVDTALAERVAFVVIAGDLYDGEWKDYNTGLFFIRQMARLRLAGIHVFITAGNHDAASRTTKSLKLPEGVHLFRSDRSETISLETPRVAIHGRSFPTPAVREDMSADYPARVEGWFNIGMLHTSATGREGHEPYAPCTLEGLRAMGYDYWALGHVHTREVLCQDPLIVFSGNIQGRHIRETGPKGCMVVTVDDDRRAKAEFRALDVVRWERCDADVTGAEDGHEAVERVRRELEELLERAEDRPLAVRVEVFGVCPAHARLVSEPEYWANEIRSAAAFLNPERIWIEKIRFLTSCSPELEQADPVDGPMAELLAVIEEACSNPERLREMTGFLEYLKARMPRELREGESALPLEDEAWLKDVLVGIRPMLRQLLLSTEQREGR
jgi:DNA repair protein SbcD/Mre11